MKKETKKVLITGCGGMLGEAVYKIFSEDYEVSATDIDLNEPWLSYLDVREIDQLERKFEEIKPEIVLHLAALTDLEYCETNEDCAWKTNALGTENVAILAKKYNAIMVYISTAGIFDGKKASYNDFDIPNPLSIYGKSKYYGEYFVKTYLEKYYVFRAGWMMGGGPKKDKKFINKLYKQIKGGTKIIKAVGDKYGSPTYTYDFAKSIKKVISSGYYGLYNQVGLGEGSRYDVACELIKLLELENEVRVEKVSSSFFNQDYSAPRPESEILINLKLDTRKINYMRDWRVALKDYAQVYKKDLEEKRLLNIDNIRK